MWPVNSSRAKLREYLLQDSGNSRVGTIIRFVVLGALLVMGGWVSYFAYTAVVSPYPLEYREGASQVMTQLLLDGRNPFSLSNQPLGTNNYGIVYSLAVLPWAALFGNTLFVHRVVAVVFILLCAIVVFRTAFIANQDIGLAVAVVELVAVVLAALGGLGAFPGSMGTFFFLTAILIPLNRGFDRRGLILSALLSLLAFYTKPYFVLAFGLVATYVFLFVSKQKALSYGLFFGVIFVACVWVVKTLLPLYFLDTVVSNLSQAAVTGPEHLFAQLKELLLEFYPALIAAAAITLAAPPRTLPALGARGPLFSRPNLRGLDRPVVSRPVDYFAYCFSLSLLVFVVILGPNTVNLMNSTSYSYQLIALPFFLWLSTALRPRSRLGLILVPLLLLNLILFCQARLNPAMLSDLREKARAWDRLYASVDGSTRILNSPEIVSEMIRLRMWPVDSGHTEFYFSIADYPWMGLFGPSHALIRSNGQNYVDALNAGVANQEYDSIIVTEQWGLPHNSSLIRQYYHLTKTVTVVMPLTMQKWDVDIWVPNGK